MPLLGNRNHSEIHCSGPFVSEKPAPVEDDSSDEEPLAKKTKKDAPSVRLLLNL